MPETLDETVARVSAEMNAQTSVVLSGEYWRSIIAVLEDYKPGNDRAKRLHHANSVESIHEIRAALRATNLDLKENGGY